MEKFKLLTELVSFRDIKNAILGSLLVLCGLILAFLTLWANRTGNLRLASIFAFLSLIFVVVIIVFVLPPLVRNAAAETSRLDFPFEFTIGGAFLIGILIVVTFAALNTGNNLLFLILSVLTSAFLVSFFMGNACLKKLDVKMRFPDVAFAGKATPITVTLYNRKRFFPCISILAEVRGVDRKRSLLADELSKIFKIEWIDKFIKPPVIRHRLSYFVHIPRTSSVQIGINHVFENRGRFIIKDFELSTTFPLGFIQHRRRLSAEEVEITIFPKIVPLQIASLGLSSEAGKLEKLQRGSGSDLLMLRDYQPQDDLRYVDWKATAKTRRLMVRDYASEDRKSVQIFFDNRIIVSAQQKTQYIRHRIIEEQRQRPFSPISLRFEEAVSKLASLLYYLDHDQIETRLLLLDYASEFSIGRAHLYSLLRRLALIEPRFIEPDEPLEYSDEWMHELKSDVGHNLLITFIEEQALPREVRLNTKIIKF